MNKACCAANLTALLSNESLPKEFEEKILPTFQKAFYSDTRGTRLQDILASNKSGKLQVTLAPQKTRGRQAQINKKVLPLALENIGSSNDKG
jgi:hypothetical protein